MNAIFLKAAEIFNMSFGQVFVAGELVGQAELVRPGRWQLFINGAKTFELEAIGEQLPKGGILQKRVIAYKGSIDTTTFDISKDEVLLLKIN